MVKNAIYNTVMSTPDDKDEEAPKHRILRVLSSGV
jgi:hypothetical protein